MGRYDKARSTALPLALAVATAVTLGGPPPALSQDPGRDGVEPRPEEEVSETGTEDEIAWSEIGDEIEERERALQEQLDSEEAERVREAVRDADDAEPPDGGEPPDGATPAALPSGEAKSAVTPQNISLPDAEGSIEGMGESFSPVLSSGTATFTVPIALPSGRAEVQPSLSLSYSSTGGNGPLGIGWSMQVPFISRQSDRGMPQYVDAESWHPEEDRFMYNGGQELIPVDTADMAAVDDSGFSYGAATVPSDVSGWQQYRARIEGSFMRFFRSPDGTRWIVQGKDGTRFDFGRLPEAEGPSGIEASSRAALQSERPGGEGRIARWGLTRMSDPHGSTVYYQYFEDDGQRYLESIHYVSPASCAAGGDPDAQRACSEPLDGYGARVHFDYEGRDDVVASYTTGWRVATAQRLSRITVTAHPEADTASGSVGARTLVRRYHLGYAPGSFHSLLERVQLEGRPDGPDSSAGGAMVGDALVDEASLGDEIIGRTLPPMVFSYSEPAGTGPSAPGFGRLDATVHSVTSSPPHSVDEARSDLFDVNSDGLPDLVVTDPARYRTPAGDPAVGVFFNGFEGSDARPAASGATFSQAVPVPMAPSLSDVLSLDNANIVPMDVDGEGRSDYLHMPRRDRYGYFVPARGPDPDGLLTSPFSQDWRWSYAQVELPSFDSDPRIDFVRDGTHYKTLDVNGDHLIDVVQTTGTAMKTWLNLGRYPGGEGRFGSATHDGSGWVLSTDPIESCLLHDGTPVDFADSEIRLADMNGDGIQDIVRIRRGDVVYWPGRGPGLWGEGPATCPRGEGDDREIVMATPPAELNPELQLVYLSDVNADGAADVVQVRYDEVDVWLNRAGSGFTGRLIMTGTPHTPDFAPRVRLSDIDGSGTGDIVWGNAHDWTYV
ncbi:MAG: SpvB/TcaC N-terminal domain-containing protein, partial [Polyangiales bacterium]